MTRQANIKLGNVCFSEAYISSFYDMEDFVKFHLQDRRIFAKLPENNRELMLRDMYRMVVKPPVKRGRQKKLAE